LCVLSSGEEQAPTIARPHKSRVRIGARLKPVLRRRGWTGQHARALPQRSARRRAAGDGDGDGDGEAFALEDEVTHIGRGMTADLRLDDHTVSARHAIVVARAAGLRILDDRSTNGTAVNGRRVVLTYRDLR
jgi:hypothetical protein